MIEHGKITPDRSTVASFIRSAGYHTAIIGKWHLNFENLDPKSGKPYSAKDFDTPPVGAKIPGRGPWRAWTSMKSAP